MTIAHVAPVDAVVRAASNIAGLPPNQHPSTWLRTRLAGSHPHSPASLTVA
jgi:hypothetical protein